MDIRDAQTVAKVVERDRPDVDRPPGGPRRGPAEHRRPALYADVNVLGTVHWLQAAARLEPRPRFVYASSSSVYGDRTMHRSARPTRSICPSAPMPRPRRPASFWPITFHHLHGLPVTGLRFFTAYGPRNRPDLAIAKFTRLIDRGEPVPMFGDGTTRRDYTFVADIVDGIVRAIERCSGHHLYNLGNSDPIELKELIDAIGAALGKDTADPAIARATGRRPADLCQH